MQTKKSLGQHWLNDEASLQAMISAGSVKPDDYVLEIGPGLGSLTKKLLETGAYIHAVELDERLAKNLQSRFTGQKFELTMQSILNFDFRKLPPTYKVIANIPYYLTSHLVRLLGELPNKPSVCVLLVQKEVAERICAKPGNMSLLAISAQLSFDCNLHEKVPSKLFDPPPKVDSQIAQLVRLPKPLFTVDSKKFYRVVKAGFLSKRKTLRNALCGGLALSKSEVEAILIQSAIDPNSRAQELSLQQWKKIYDTVLEYES